MKNQKFYDGPFNFAPAALTLNQEQSDMLFDEIVSIVPAYVFVAKEYVASAESFEVKVSLDQFEYVCVRSAKFFQDVVMPAFSRKLETPKLHLSTLVIQGMKK